MRLWHILAGLVVADLLAIAVPGLSPGVRLGAHVVLTLVGFAAMARRGRFGIAAATLGLVGPVGLVAAHVLAWRRRLRLSAPPEATDPGAMESPATGARMLDGRMHHAAPDALGSLVTVLRHGSVSARRRALETVVRSFEPTLSPLIARALADGDQTIRALAAAAAARMSRNLAHRRVALADRAARGDAEAGDALIALLADHARDNILLSDAQRDQLRREVVSLLHDRPPGDTRNHALEAVLAESAWAERDYEMIDALAGRRRDDSGDALGWWRTEARA